jgi:hypothetical protein
MIGQMTVQREALAGFVTGWDCRGNLDDDVDRAQAAPITALGGVVHEPGCISSGLARPSLWRRSTTSLVGCASWRCWIWGKTMAETTMDKRLAHLGPTERNVRYAATMVRRFCVSVLPRQSLPLSADFMGSAG